MTQQDFRSVVFLVCGIGCFALGARLEHDGLPFVGILFGWMVFLSQLRR